MVAHVKVVERWEDGKPTPMTPDAKVITHNSQWRGEFDSFFTAVYADGYLQVRVQNSDDDTTA